MKRIYLDHAAATPVSTEVQKAMALYWGETFGNPSSIHEEGVLAKSAMANARRSIAEELGVHADEIIFTGSATESCNLELRGTVMSWRQNHPEQTPHIVVCAIEHDAVLAAARALEREGATLSIISVDKEGIIDIDELLRAITKDTVIISIGYANNEIGVVQPIRAIARAIRNWKKEVRGTSRDVRAEGDDCYPLFHTDACQATNYLELRVPQLGVDLMTLNAAKIYGPKGIGLLFVGRTIPVYPLITGGGQERGLRAGTENIPLIVGFAEALRIAASERRNECDRLMQLQDYLIAELQTQEDVTINGSLTSRLPNNINIALRGADHEFVTIALDAKGIAVSTKSACNEADAEHSHVLMALQAAGHDGEPSGLRISLGRSTTKKDIDLFLFALLEIRKTLVVALV